MDTQMKSGKMVDTMFGSYGQSLSWVEFMASDKRLPAMGAEEVGSKAMGFKDAGDLIVFAPGVRCRFKLSFDIVPRELFLLNSDTIFHYVSKELGVLDVDGNFLHLSPGSAAFNASLLGYMCSIENIGCDWFDANAVIRDLSDVETGDE